MLTTAAVANFTQVEAEDPVVKNDMNTLLDNMSLLYNFVSQMSEVSVLPVKPAASTVDFYR